jgi:hypothetical protein
MAIVMRDQPTLATLLDRYRTQAIAEAVGAHPEVVLFWRRGQRVPVDPDRIEALADFMRMDARELFVIIARDKKRIRSGRDTVLA